VTACDDFGQVIKSRVVFASFARRLPQLEHHVQHAFAGQAALLNACGAMAESWQNADFNGLAGADALPMLGGKSKNAMSSSRSFFAGTALPWDTLAHRFLMNKSEFALLHRLCVSALPGYSVDRGLGLWLLTAWAGMLEPRSSFCVASTAAAGPWDKLSCPWRPGNPWPVLQLPILGHSFPGF